MALKIVAYTAGQTRPATSLGVHVSMHAIVVSAVVVILLVLGARARYHHRRLNRSYSRAMSYSSPRKQLSTLNKLGVVHMATTAKRAKWTLRKAIVAVVLIAVIRVWLEGHG